VGKAKGEADERVGFGDAVPEEEEGRERVAELEGDEE